MPVRSILLALLVAGSPVGVFAQDHGPAPAKPPAADKAAAPVRDAHAAPAKDAHAAPAKEAHAAPAKDALPHQGYKGSVLCIMIKRIA